MKTIKHTPNLPAQTPKAIKSTNADALGQLAATITRNVMEGIEEGNVDVVEATGNISMSILMTQYTSGLLDDKQAFAFFKEMATKKTQTPVQRVDQHVKLDLGEVFNGIAASNASIRSNRLSQAKVWDGEVRERLQLDDKMMLRPLDEEEHSATTFTPEPPPEIEDIRTGGDGSEKRQKWSTQGATPASYRKDSDSQ